MADKKLEIEVDIKTKTPEPAKVPVEPPAPVKVTPQVDPKPAITGFSAISAASAALRGDIAGLGVELSKLSSGFASIKNAGVIGMTALGAALLGIRSSAIALRDLIATTFNFRSAGDGLTRISGSLVDIKSAADQFNIAMDETRKTSELVNASLEKQVDALGRIAKAQNEIARQRDLANASTDTERDAINSRYDRSGSDIQANSAAETAELKRKAIVEEIARLEKEIANSKDVQRSYENAADAARTRARIYGSGGVVGSMLDSAASSVTGMRLNQSRAQAANNAATNAQNAADDEIERQGELEEKLEKARHDLKMADLDAEARKQEEAAEREKIKSAEQSRTAALEKRQGEAQADFERTRTRALEDADFERQMRDLEHDASRPLATKDDVKASEDNRLALLEQREAEARERLAEAERTLAEEMEKPVRDRDETVLSRARSDMTEAQGDMISARQRREQIETARADRKEQEQVDRFKALAGEIESSRPKDRLTAMGLSSGTAGVGQPLRDIQRDLSMLVRLTRDEIKATRENKPTEATYS